MIKGQLLSPKQVAEKLQINYHKILEFIMMGELKAYKIGGVNVFNLVHCLISCKRNNINHIGKVNYSE